MDDEAVKHSAQILNAISVAWREIRARHDEVPVVTAMFGSASLAAQSDRTLAHFGAQRYGDGTDELVNELFVAVEGLVNGPVEVLGYLLHEGAHGVAFTRQVKDCSNRGRYHNGRFVKIARSMGLDVKRGEGRDAKYGWAFTSIPERTAKRFGTATDALAEACRLYLLAGPEEEERKPSEPSVPMTCACGRRLGIPMKTARTAPFRCNRCHQIMRPNGEWLASKGLTSWRWDEFGPEVTITLTEELMLQWGDPGGVPPSFSNPDGSWLYAGDEPRLKAQESMFGDLTDVGQLPCLRCRKLRVDPIELRRQRDRAKRLGIQRTWANYCMCTPLV